MLEVDMSHSIDLKVFVEDVKENSSICGHCCRRDELKSAVAYSCVGTDYMCYFS